MNNMELSSKVAVISGATGGVGRALIKELDNEGVVCVLLGTHKEELDNLSSSFTDPKNIVTVSEKIVSDLPSIDFLVNLAGIGVYKPMEEVTLDEFQNSFSIGVTAAYFLTKGLLSKLSKSDVALVLNMGSGMGVIPAPGRSVYCASKFALRGMTLSLAEEFKKSKPNFCLITSGSILTPFGPMSLEEKRREMEEGKAYFTPEWMAKKLVEIIKDENREMEYTLYPTDYVGGSWKAPNEDSK
jgi:short-subunit dehydrogenase